MTNLDYIRLEVSQEELWALLGEEATELAHAAQKMRRVLTGRNPSPVGLGEAKDKVFEELADVMLCLLVLRIDIEHPALVRIMAEKLGRWVHRLKEAKNECST